MKNTKNLACKFATAMMSTLLVLSSGVAFAASKDEDQVKSIKEVYTSKKHVRPELRWKSGPYVTWCKSGDAVCTKAKMSKKIGKVEKVVPGKFLSGVRTSWIAFTKDNSFLCALLEVTNHVACSEIGVALPLERLDIRYLASENKGKGALVFLDSSIQTTPAELPPFITKFQKELTETRTSLQEEIAGTGRYIAMSTASVCDDGGTVPPDDPCTGEDGSATCPVVVVPGTPEPPPSYEPPPTLPNPDPGLPDDPPEDTGNPRRYLPGYPVDKSKLDPVRVEACKTCCDRGYTSMEEQLCYKVGSDYWACHNANTNVWANCLADCGRGEGVCW